MATKNTPEKVFDLRTLEYSLAKGEISAKDYEKYLKELPNDEGNWDPVEFTEEETSPEASPDPDTQTSPELDALLETGITSGLEEE